MPFNGHSRRVRAGRLGRPGDFDRAVIHVPDVTSDPEYQFASSVRVLSLSMCPWRCQCCAKDANLRDSHLAA